MGDKSHVGCSLLDVPDEILLEIILHLNARERVALANSAKKFQALVFEEKRSLRALDFSEDGYLTIPSDVIQYFNNNAKYEEIRKINISNMYCTTPGEMFQNMAKAKNLVVVNVSGIIFESFKQFTSLLEPLKGLKKLTSTWPTGPKDDHCNKILSETFGRLTHLTMTLCNLPDKWRLLRELEVCQELEELRLVQAYEYGNNRGRAWLQKPAKLHKLRLAICCGSDTPVIDIVVSDMLSDPGQWTAFQPSDYGNVLYFYYEKNVQVSEELNEDVCRTQNPYISRCVKLGWDLNFKSLLQEVVRISNQTTLDEFCCLIKRYTAYSYLPRMRDAQLLLKNPRGQISHLNLVHDMESVCDIHLVALAFPNLTTLVLSNIVIDKAAAPQKTPIKTGSKRKQTAPEQGNVAPNLNISFKKLVENSPHLQDLTIYARRLIGTSQTHKIWDLAALDLIAGWKNLTNLFLANLPIKSGQFLVEIGSQCTNLEKLRLENLGSRANWCYKKALPKMLALSHNLKDFSIEQDNLGEVSHLFDTLLAESLQLRRLHVKSLGAKNIVDELDSSVQKLIRSRKLVLLVIEIEGITDEDYDQLRITLQRLKDVLGLPTFQFEVKKGVKVNPKDKTPRYFSQLDLVHKDLLLPHSFIDALRRLDCSS